MKTLTLSKNSPGETICLAKNRIASTRSKYISIQCLSGSLWITWPNGLEQTLTGGQSVSGKSSGKVCIVALSDAKIQVKQKHMSWYTSFYPKWLPQKKWDKEPSYPSSRLQSAG